MITIGETQVNSIIDFASGMISDLVPVFLFIGGVLIGIYILQSLLIKDKNKED